MSSTQTTRPPAGTPVNRAARDPRQALPRLDPFKPRGGPVRKSKRGRWRAFVLIGVHVAIFLHIAHWQVTGTTMTPLEPSESMQTLELGYVNAGFIVFCLLILSTLVLGRFFCGWACHVVALQDLCNWGLKKLGLKPRPLRSRLLILVPFGAAIYMFFWPTIARWFAGGAAPELSWHLTTDSFWATFPGPGMAILTFVVDGFLIVYWLGAKGFCTYGCPYGAFFGVADRFATGRIKVTDACETCGHCTATCTSNVRVHEEVAKYRMVVDPGCMKCMDCISVCPKDALYFGFDRPSLFVKRDPNDKRRRASRSDFSWGEEIAMAVVFCAALIAFRDLYNLVPFLLALGLSVITAVCAVAVWRLWRRTAVRFQHLALRRDGRLTRAGGITLALSLALLAFAAHSLPIGAATWLGRRSADAALAAGSAEQHARSLQAALGSYEFAAGWGLLPNGELEYEIAMVLAQQGRFDEAEPRFRRAAELEPGEPLIAANLANVLNRTGQHEAAESVARTLIGEHADVPEAFFELSWALKKQERFEPAEAALRDALAVRGDYPIAQTELASLLIRKNALDEAEAVLRSVLERHPADEKARFLLDVVRRRRG